MRRGRRVLAARRRRLDRRRVHERVRRPRFGVDRLSGFFLGTLGLVALPALVFSLALPRADRARPHGRRAHRRCSCSRSPASSARATRSRSSPRWELMTLLPAAVILVARDADGQSRRTVFIYLAVTHLGGAGTWIAVLLLAARGRVRRRRGDRARARALQIAIALAALVGMGTKAGVMPLHVWLPRAHPIAPAPVSALMSGVMIKVAIYGARPRARRLGRRAAASGSACSCSRSARCRPSAASSTRSSSTTSSGCSRSTRSRTSGSSCSASAPASCCARAARTRGRRSRSAAALLHTLNHAVFKALLFLGAGAFERAVGSLELDRLGGLLRRMPWTGGAFLVGAMAIAGLPPLNGFASEWLTLQALLHVPRVRRRRRRHRRARSRSPRSRRPRRSRSSAS